MKHPPLFFFLLLFITPLNTDALLRGEDSLKRKENENRGLKKTSLYGERGGAAGTSRGTNSDAVGFFENAAENDGKLRLPKSLSDHTACEWNSLVYIAGGCDSPYTQERGHFRCASVSENFYLFDPAKSTNHFTNLPNLPSPRYRHTSAAVNDHIWLIGGRDVNGNLLEFVDIFDISTQSWTSLYLPIIRQVSDHATFIYNNFIFVVGGYGLHYIKQDRMYRINTELSVESLDIEEMNPLTRFGGKVNAVQDSQYAYVAAGYSTFECSGVGMIERYDLTTREWESMVSFHARQNFGMAQLKGIVVILGGEKLSDDFCADMTANSQSIFSAAETVAFLDMLSDSWLDVGQSPKSRFPALSFSEEDSLFTFGGLKEYDEGCNCFPASSEIVNHNSLYHSIVLARLSNNMNSLVPAKEPSQHPTAYPKLSPTDKPSMVPVTKTTTSSPTASPSKSPTKHPTPAPIRRPTPAPLPYIDPNHSFKLRLQWERGYYWQCDSREKWWCLECTDCDEDGAVRIKSPVLFDWQWNSSRLSQIFTSLFLNLFIKGDGREHGCSYRGDGSAGNCRNGDLFWIKNCKRGGTKFNIVQTDSSGVMIRLDDRSLCLERSGKYVKAKTCNKNDSDQQWASIDNIKKFELRPLKHEHLSQRDAKCISQHHHPKDEEVVSMWNCRLAESAETNYWMEY